MNSDYLSVCQCCKYTRIGMWLIDENYILYVQYWKMKCIAFIHHIQEHSEEFRYILVYGVNKFVIYFKDFTLFKTYWNEYTSLSSEMLTVENDVHSFHLLFTGIHKKKKLSSSNNQSMSVYCYKWVFSCVIRF